MGIIKIFYNIERIKMLKNRLRKGNKGGTVVVAIHNIGLHIVALNKFLQ